MNKQQLKAQIETRISKFKNRKPLLRHKHSILNMDRLARRIEAKSPNSDFSEEFKYNEMYLKIVDKRLKEVWGRK